MVDLPSKQNKEKYVREMFNNIAGRYDIMNTLMSFGLDKSWRRLTVSRAELKPGGNGLDVCCGTGMLTMEQAKAAGSAGKITGLDFSENMLAVARENVKQFELRDIITFIQGNAMELRLETELQRTTGALLDRDDRRFVQHDPLTLHVDQGVGGAEIDRDLICWEETTEIEEWELHQDTVCGHY